jgi:hypothetical protein
MSFGAAVSLAQMLGMLVSVLWLVLPIGAVVSMRRRRSNRPGASCWFAYLTIVAWGLSLVGFVVLFASGRWYGESGPSPQQAAMQAAVLLVILAGIHLLLMTMGSPERERTDAT